MTATSAVSSFERRNGLLAIAIGGPSAGIFDLTQALILFGTKVPLGIAAGLLGLLFAAVYLIAAIPAPSLSRADLIYLHT